MMDEMVLVNKAALDRLFKAIDRMNDDATGGDDYVCTPFTREEQAAYNIVLDDFYYPKYDVDYWLKTVPEKESE